MIYEITDTAPVLPLFAHWEETLIWSCLQGIMGKIYADDLKNPASALAVLGDFSFFAGKPNPELAAYKPSRHAWNFMIMVPQNEGWKDLILRIYANKATPVLRYAIKKEPHIFHKETLEEAAASLPKEYEISMIDEELYRMCKEESWSRDLVSQFPSYEDFRRLGLGVAARKNHVIVSGASSYARYRDGIEIEIDTREDHRRMGLARACGARLILECLKRDLYPSWDAQNQASAALAEKLGYHVCHTYTAIEIRD